MTSSNKKLLTGALALAVSTLGATAVSAETEKCYGVVKAGKNGCAGGASKHSCQGQSKHDADGSEWVPMPKGLCAKIVGGKLEAHESDADKTRKAGEK